MLFNIVRGKECFVGLSTYIFRLFINLLYQECIKCRTQYFLSSTALNLALCGTCVVFIDSAEIDQALP